MHRAHRTGLKNKTKAYFTVRICFIMRVISMIMSKSRMPAVNIHSVFCSGVSFLNFCIRCSSF